jgi:hypothetical protein
MSPKSKKNYERMRQKRLSSKKRKDQQKKAKTEIPVNQPDDLKEIRFKYPHLEFLLEMGPLIPAEIHVPKAIADEIIANGGTAPPPVKGSMIIDTGAMVTSVADHVVKALNLNPTSTVLVHGFHGSQEVFKYFVTVVVVGENVRFMATGNLASCNLRNEMFEYYEKQGISIIGLLGRDFFKDKTLICDFIKNSVTIRYHPK